MQFCDSGALLNFWYPVAESDDVADGVIAVRLLGSDYAIWRSPAGAVVAAPDRCPHCEAPLSIGRVEDGQLVSGAAPVGESSRRPRRRPRSGRIGARSGGGAGRGSLG